MVHGYPCVQGQSDKLFFVLMEAIDCGRQQVPCEQLLGIWELLMITRACLAKISEQQHADCMQHVALKECHMLFTMYQRGAGQQAEKVR